MNFVLFFKEKKLWGVANLNATAFHLGYFSSSRFKKEQFHGTQKRIKATRQGQTGSTKLCMEWVEETAIHASLYGVWCAQKIQLTTRLPPYFEKKSNLLS